MAQSTNDRRQLAGQLKSAIASAAIVGMLGGWVAFGAQQAADTTATQVASVATSDTTASQDTSAATTSAASASSSAATTSGVASVPVSARVPVTSTRSSS